MVNFQFLNSLFFLSIPGVYYIKKKKKHHTKDFCVVIQYFVKMWTS